MADEFDPLKQTINKPSEDLYATVQKKNINNDDDLLRPEYENILKVGEKQTNKSPESQPKEEVYHKLDFKNTAYKAPIRSTNQFEGNIRELPPSTYVTSSLPQAAAAATSGQRIGSYEQNTEDQNYETESPPGYCYDEYYENQLSYKKKGFSSVIRRFVRRIPILSMLSRDSSASETYETEQPQEYVEEKTGDEPPQLVDENQIPRELTADELALNERYSNKLRTQVIRLQQKDQTQPVDVSIHHESYTIYSCDAGRNVIEIFDMYGKLQHVIDDQTTIKFQPTSVAVAYDGTILTASHFSHCLHMYSPSSDVQGTEQVHNGYQFQQYKLGSPGQGIHEFRHPAGIAIDYNDGYLYVCDRGNFRIQVLRPEGICERVIELFLQDQQQSCISPIQIAHQQNGDQIVCIIDAGDALCFIPKNADGPTHVEPFYVIDNDGLGLQGATGIVIDCDDRIFISDTGHHRIVICTPEGGYITHFGTEGYGAGELKRPCGLDVTNDGTVVVADSGNKRLQLFGSVREQAVQENKSPIKKSDDKDDPMIDLNTL